MKRKASAIVQRKEGWYGVTFSVEDRGIGEVDFYVNNDLPELKKLFEETTCGVAVENSSAFLFNLTFPFTDKRKISLVIKNELEEMLPFSLDDMAVDFVPNDKGGVLAAAIPKSLSDEFRAGKQSRITTVQALAVLHALKWFNVVYQRDFVFLHMNRDAVVIMGFKDDQLYYLRQFFHSPQSNALVDAFEEISRDREFHPRAFVMVGDGENATVEKENLERTFRIQIQMPLLKKLLKNEDTPEWLWAGIGAGLLSLRPKGELNVTGEKDRYSFLSNKASLYISGGLAAFSILIFSLFYLDYYFKEKTYEYLSSEPARIYRAVFPKSPPAKDVVRMFQDKIKLLDKEPGSSAVTSGSPLAILNEISSKITADTDIRISEFASDDKEFTISGTTISFASLEKIKADMEQIRDIAQVEVQNIELTPNKQVKFKVRGKL